MSDWVGAGRPSHVPAPAVFLGALASEVNEPDELAPAFATLADVTERIVAAVRGGHLAERDAAEHLRVLRLTGQDGVAWCVGATSLRWYRRTSDRPWKLGIPPTQADESHEATLAQALAALPAELIAQLGAMAGQDDTYLADPFAQAAAHTPDAWEYELGDDRRLSYGSEVP